MRARGFSLVCASLFGAASTGCPGDNTDGDNADGDEVGQTEDSDGDDDGDGEPVCPTSVAGTYDLIVEPVFSPDAADGHAQLQALCDPANDLFSPADDSNISWSSQAVQLVIYRPADPVDGDWPAGRFPLVFHHHGNGGQNGERYDHIAEAVVDDGAIFVSVAGQLGADPGLRAMIDICMLRWLFTADDWDGDGLGNGGASRLDGNVVVMGHSNGGEGAHIVYNWFEEQPWQDDLAAPEHQMRLCGIIGIAPRGAGEACIDENDETYQCNAPFSSANEISSASTVPYLTMEGSLDNDVPGGSLWNSSHSAFDELHTQTDAAKIAVWVYDAEHDGFGGGGLTGGNSTRGQLSPPIEEARGHMVAATWTDAFMRRFVFGDLAAEPVLFGREIPGSLDVAAWWDYHPAYVGEPLIFFGTEPHQSAAPEELGVRTLVDTMCRPWSRGVVQCLPTAIADGTSTSSEGEEFLADNWPSGSLRSDFAIQLAAYAGTRGTYQTTVLRADYTAPGEPNDPINRMIAWNLQSFDLANADAFSFRASNVDEIEYAGSGLGCVPVDGDPADETDFEVVFVSVDDLEVSVRASDFVRLVAPDVFEVARADFGFDCPVSHFLQSVRIPLDEVLCDSFPPEKLREVRFVFDRFDGPEGRAVLLDTVEFHRDLSGAPVCRG